MKILLSPAKSLDFKTKLPTEKHTELLFGKEASTLVKTLKNKSKDELKSLMSISDNLALLNAQRYQDFSFPFSANTARAAIYAFSGDVYVGLDTYSIEQNKIDLLQNSVRILSGLYGYLKPLDLIMPYRLEMGTQLSINGHNNLYEFWGDKITKALNNENKEGDIVLNLASNEYFKSIKAENLHGTLISPVFKDFKNGKLKIISFYAKKARGLMTRYVIDNSVTRYEDLLKFNTDGYAYSQNETTNPNEPVFIR